MAKDKFLRFQNQKKGYLLRFKYDGYKVENATQEDLVLKELLECIDDNLFYDNKLLMFRFKKRWNNFNPEYRKIII